MTFTAATWPASSELRCSADTLAAACVRMQEPAQAADPGSAGQPHAPEDVAMQDQAGEEDMSMGEQVRDLGLPDCSSLLALLHLRCMHTAPLIHCSCCLVQASKQARPCAAVLTRLPPPVCTCRSLPKLLIQAQQASRTHLKTWPCGTRLGRRT